MTDAPLEAIDDAMAGIRRAVEGQLGTERPEWADVDPTMLTRFSDALPEELSQDERERLLARAEELQPWLQGPFLVGGDLVIGGAWRNDHRWVVLGDALPEDLSGKRVLDVGSNAGYDPFMFSRRGADYVLGCEPFEFIEQALFLESIYKTGVDFQRIGWQDLDPAVQGTFDLVHCHGVLYHEPNPMGLLARLWHLTAPGGTLLLGSMMLADPTLSEYARYVPLRYYGDPTWWWVPGRLTLRWLIETAGFDVAEAFGESPGPPGEFPTINGYVRGIRVDRPPVA
jgi:tRNA (mo5U34)-methyltransferase